MSTPLTALPADAILLHVGPHKTGTSAIQSILADARPQLRTHGVSYPGKRVAHHVEARSALQIPEGWNRGPTAVPNLSVWKRFAENVAQRPGRVVISSEFFAVAEPDVRRMIIGDLGAERVRVLVAARQPAAMAVSMWQQVLRTGYPVTLDQWLKGAFRRTDASHTTGFWQRADIAGLASNWAETAGLDRVMVVINDERDRRLQPATFEELLDLPVGLLADRKPPQTNRGLSATEAALLHSVILTLDSKLTWAEFSRTIRFGVARRLLETRRPGPDEPKSALPDWAVTQAATESSAIIDRLRESGIRLLGDPETLRVTPGDTTAPAPIEAIPLDLATEAVVGAIAGATRGNWSLDAPRREPSQQPAPAPQQPGPSTQPPSPWVDEISTRDLAGVLRARVRAGLHRRYQKARHKLRQRADSTS